MRSGTPGASDPVREAADRVGVLPVREMSMIDTRRPAIISVALTLALVVACSRPEPTRPSPSPSPVAGAAPATAQPRATPSTPTADGTTSPVPAPTAPRVATPSPTPAPTTPSSTPVALGATTLPYDTYDTTGAVSMPGSYAFLSNPDDMSTAVTTYDALRDGTTTALLIHKSDADGASRAAFYDAVEAGDVFGWHKADDCFVHYSVTEVRPDPAGTVPRKLLTVEWMAYAFTGCRGAVSTGATVSVDWGTLPYVGWPRIAFPIQRVPGGWTGVVEPSTYREPSGWSEPGWTTDLAEARTLPLWREPDLPTGWTLTVARSGDVSTPPYGYCADYGDGRDHVEICAGHMSRREAPGGSTDEDGLRYETRAMEGRPALVRFSAPGPTHDEMAPVVVWVHDPDTGSLYTITGGSPSLRGSNVDAVVDIARSLLESPDDPDVVTPTYLPESPTFDAPPGVYTNITVGADHACALTEDGVTSRKVVSQCIILIIC